MVHVHVMKSQQRELCMQTTLVMYRDHSLITSRSREGQGVRPACQFVTGRGRGLVDAYMYTWVKISKHSFISFGRIAPSIRNYSSAEICMQLSANLSISYIK